MKVAVVGAQGTGKSTLVAALQLVLQTDPHPIACTVVEGWAQADHRSYDLSLLMGLDLPNDSDAEHRVASARCDDQLRQTMGQHAITYAVVYGSGPARMDSALQAIAHHSKQAATKRSPVKASEWNWCCDTCSDAACEHRLFTALVNKPPESVRP